MKYVYKVKKVKFTKQANQKDFYSLLKIAFHRNMSCRYHIIVHAYRPLTPRNNRLMYLNIICFPIPIFLVRYRNT